MRLTAAVALANAGDDKDARPVLADIVDGTPAGREQWLRANGALWKLGDAKAKTALDAELAQPDALRAVAAGEAAREGRRRQGARVPRARRGRQGLRPAR